MHFQRKPVKLLDEVTLCILRPLQKSLPITFLHGFI